MSLGRRSPQSALLQPAVAKPMAVAENQRRHPAVVVEVQAADSSARFEAP